MNVSVRLRRTPLGFGFTLSGQSPCLLSHVVPGSPAALAGLRPGDAVLTAQGVDVTARAHDRVVALISEAAELALTLKTSSASSSMAEETVSDGEEYTLRPGRQRRREELPGDLQLGAFGQHFHARGNSADSTLTESSQARAMGKGIDGKAFWCWFANRQLLSAYIFLSGFLFWSQREV